MRWSTYLGHDNYFLTREVMVLDSFAQDDLRETVRVDLRCREDAYEYCARVSRVRAKDIRLQCRSS